MNYMFLIFFSSSEFIVNQTRDEYYFKHYDGFSHENGFNMAAAIVGIGKDGEFDTYIDPEIG